VRCFAKRLVSYLLPFDFKLSSSHPRRRDFNLPKAATSCSHKLGLNPVQLSITFSASSLLALGSLVDSRAEVLRGRTALVEETTEERSEKRVEDDLCAARKENTNQPSTSNPKIVVESAYPN